MFSGTWCKSCIMKFRITLTLKLLCLHVQSTELNSRLSGLLERYQQYQDEVVSLHSWLSTQEQNQSIAKPSGETDPQNLENTLRQVQVRYIETFK